MSLYGAIQQSANSLAVAELGLQVTGNNISNANTPGYIRQELVQSTAIGVRHGDLILGYGVHAVGVVQRIDNFILDRMRNTQSALSYNEQLQEANSLIETAINELSNDDLSSLMSRFSNAFHDLSSQPASASFRNLVLQRGAELASGLANMSRAADDIQIQTTTNIQATAAEINRLTKGIANLNQRIVETEGGRTSKSDAVGLRDERIKLLDELSQYVDISAREQASGAVTVLVGGDYLVADGLQRDVEAANAGADGFVEIHIVDTDAPLKVTGGKLKGLYEARDGAAASFKKTIDELAHQIIYQVNRIHSEGQGARGLTTVTSDNVFKDPYGPLEQAGLPFEIENGSFVIKVHDNQTGLTTTHEISVRQQGFDSDTTGVDLAAQLDALSGITATIGNDGRLRIDSDSDAIQFTFANDTSGVLAALGVNSFFQGNSASTIQVRSDLVSDPSLLSTSLDGIGNGAGNAVRLAEVFDHPIAALSNRSLRDFYEATVVTTTQKISAQKGVTEGLRNFYHTLQSQSLSVSGVSLDEEAIKMLTYQRTFQASSRLISAINELFDTLVNIV